jgi:hypothetical protein
MISEGSHDKIGIFYFCFFTSSIDLEDCLSDNKGYLLTISKTPAPLRII